MLFYQLPFCQRKKSWNGQRSEALQFLERTAGGATGSKNQRKRTLHLILLARDGEGFNILAAGSRSQKQTLKQQRREVDRKPAFIKRGTASCQILYSIILIFLSKHLNIQFSIKAYILSDLNTKRQFYIHFQRYSQLDTSILGF